MNIYKENPQVWASLTWVDMQLRFGNKHVISTFRKQQLTFLEKRILPNWYSYYLLFQLTYMFPPTSECWIAPIWWRRRTSGQNVTSRGFSLFLIIFSPHRRNKSGDTVLNVLEHIPPHPVFVFERWCGQVISVQVTLVTKKTHTGQNITLLGKKKTKIQTWSRFWFNSQSNQQQLPDLTWFGHF